MSEERKTEVIKNLTKTINDEKAKSTGGNPELIQKLTKKLQSIEDGTHISKLRKKKQ